jgi:putative addiction module component (TIGR02574 family)
MEQFSPPRNRLRGSCGDRIGVDCTKRERAAGRLCPAVELYELTSRPTEASAQAKARSSRPRQRSGQPPLKPKAGLSGHPSALGLYTMSDLRHQIENLSAFEKAELLDAVWESLEADAPSLTDAQGAELDCRIERHEQNPSDVIPWEQVRASLFKKL